MGWTLYRQITDKSPNFPDRVSWKKQTNQITPILSRSYHHCSHGTHHMKIPFLVESSGLSILAISLLLQYDENSCNIIFVTTISWLNHHLCPFVYGLNQSKSPCCHYLLVKSPCYCLNHHVKIGQITMFPSLIPINHHFFHVLTFPIFCPWPVTFSTELGPNPPRRSGEAIETDDPKRHAAGARELAHHDHRLDHAWDHWWDHVFCGYQIFSRLDRVIYCDDDDDGGYHPIDWLWLDYY